jgi:hypothetical protein
MAMTEYNVFQVLWEDSDSVSLYDFHHSSSYYYNNVSDTFNGTSLQWDPKAHDVKGYTFERNRYIPQWTEV